MDLPGPPRVLLVEAAPSALRRALVAQGLEVVAVPPPGSGSADGAAVVVLGAGAAGWPGLEETVRAGTGLLVTGGRRDTAGAGRVRGTPLAKALPVFLPPPPVDPPPAPAPPPPKPPRPAPPAPAPAPAVDPAERERPGALVTLLLVVDTSGSMQGLKLEMARLAAEAAASTLAPEDRFGLLSFREMPQWGLAPSPAGDLPTLRRALRALEADGGTDLLPALQEARRALRREETAVRHIIVLSDGETSIFGLREVVSDLVADGVTVSSVGIGGGFDSRVLGSLAAWGKGRSYAAVDPTLLPRVVTVDAKRVAEGARSAAAKPLKDSPPTPPADPVDAPPDASTTEDPSEPPGAVDLPPPEATGLEAAVGPGDRCALLEGVLPFTSAVPPVAAPQARLGTTVALRFTATDEPLLVLGRHGLGRTAWLSCAHDGGDGETEGPWPATEGYAAFCARLVRGLAPAGTGPGAELLQVRPLPGGTEVAFTLRGEEVLPLPEVSLLQAAGDGPAPLEVRRRGSRTFAAVLPPGRRGGRTLAVTGGDGATVPLPVFDPGPPPPAPPPTAAERAADLGATAVDAPPPPAGPSPPGPPRELPLAPWLLAGAAVALLLDALLRRA